MPTGSVFRSLKISGRQDCNIGQENRRDILIKKQHCQFWFWILIIASLLITCTKKKDGSNLILQPDMRNAEITVVSGNYQKGSSGEQLTEPIVISVTDLSGDPIPDIEVSFQFIDRIGID